MGKAKPKKNGSFYHVRVTQETLEALSRRADELGMSQSDLARAVLEAAAQSQRSQAKPPEAARPGKPH